MIGVADPQFWESVIVVFTIYQKYLWERFMFQSIETGTIYTITMGRV